MLCWSDQILGKVECSDLLNEKHREIVAEDLDAPHGLSTDGLDLYWMDAAGQVMRAIPMSGSDVTVMEEFGQNVTALSFYQVPITG